MKTNLSFKEKVINIGINNYNNEDLLKYALESGIINMENVQEQLLMNQRKKYLSLHKNSIWQGKDGKWRTRLPKEPSGVKMYKRNTLKEIEDIVIEYYQSKEEKFIPITFNDMYFKWRDIQKELVSDNTIAKYQTDYVRYFEDTDFASTPIAKITEEEIKVFICKTIKEQNLCKKACKTLIWYIKSVFKTARYEVTENPAKYIETKFFYKYCIEKKRNIDKIIVTQEEMKQLYMRFKLDHIENPSYIPTYAVEFATLTGMRVGEIAGLTWDCITDKYIIVNKSEKRNKLTKQYYIDTTKNKTERIFPITEDIRKLLLQVKKVEMQYGYLCEWVFANENGRIHGPMISSCSKTKCRQLGITEKGIHAYRRTINSQMRCNGVSATVAAALLGHTEQVNDQYYTFDIAGIDEKEKIVSQINAKTVSGL